MTSSLSTPNKWFSILSDYLVIIIGVALYAYAWAGMLIPNGVASGGLTGACTILNFATGIPVSLSYIVVNAVLLLFGFLILGNAFGFKTIFAILCSTLFLDLFERWEASHMFFSDKLLLVVVAAIIESIGLAAVFVRGGSTGGTDIIALIVHKFWPVTLGKVFILLDVFIIASVLLVPGKTVEDMVYGYVAMVIFSVMVDWVMLGRKSTCQILVFSDHYQEIADQILLQLDRGVTALDATGWYTGADRKVLLILIRKRELRDITRLIKSIDHTAFVSVSDASSVYGEGFDEIKTGINLKKKKE
jgi:uncharacterized membrane-anchored protein YitT (DUF2179 family)